MSRTRATDAATHRLGRYEDHAPGPWCGRHERWEDPAHGTVTGYAGDVHDWFGLSYASYLVWPRSLMQRMPADWQHRFAVLAAEADASFQAPLQPEHGAGYRSYEVRLRDERGRWSRDRLSDYRYPDEDAVEQAKLGLPGQEEE